MSLPTVYVPSPITETKKKELRRLFLVWALLELPYEDLQLQEDVKRIQSNKE